MFDIEKYALHNVWVLEIHPLLLLRHLAQSSPVGIMLCEVIEVDVAVVVFVLLAHVSGIG